MLWNKISGLVSSSLEWYACSIRGKPEECRNQNISHLGIGSMVITLAHIFFPPLSLLRHTAKRIASLTTPYSNKCYHNFHNTKPHHHCKNSKELERRADKKGRREKRSNIDDNVLGPFLCTAWTKNSILLWALDEKEEEWGMPYDYDETASGENIGTLGLSIGGWLLCE